MIDKYSGDALRFWAAGSKLGDDLPFQEKDLVTGIKMSTKLWNASRFAITMLKDYHLEKPSFLANHHLTATDTGGMLLIDRWLLCKLHKLIKECTESFDKYEYVKTKAEVEKFFWHTLCDNYIEIVKTRLYNAEKYGVAVTTSGRYALYQAISTVLKMLAPIMPYITESVYQLYFAKMEKKQSIHHESWPSCDDRLIDETVEQTGDLFVDVLSTVRKYKSENDKALNWPVAELVIECSDADKKTLSAMLDDLKNATTSSQITFGVGNIACSEHSVRVKIVLGEKKEKND
ncbi:TPA: class I tRNA ligase family protein [Candidatus Woesearchaeota archaeon]|nr:class I tRNA ligase family protein [Candidatus Woesearchaeota archaeon]